MPTFSLAEFVHHLAVLISVGCLLLVTGVIYFLLSLLRESGKILEQFASLKACFAPQGPDRQVGKTGLSLTAWDEIQSRAGMLDPQPAAWWQRVTDASELYPTASGEEAFFLTEAATAVLPYGTLTASLRAERYRSLPGLLTGVGLTLTFMAILGGLSGVHYDRTNTTEPITGIDILINGLSGKFLSSIVALLLSIAFTLFEQSRTRKLRNAYADLIQTLSHQIPRLSAARILLDIRKSSADASVEVANISADVVSRFADALNQQVVPQLASSMATGVAGAFYQQISPTLDKMTGSLDTLQGAIVGLEEKKQDSMTGEFERLLRGLEQSLTGALEHMASGFREALSGSARDEFGNMQATLEGTRAMLGGMNDQFGAMQLAFRDVVAKAEEATLHQVSTGREQTEELNRVMQGLLSGIAAGTAESMQAVQEKLGTTVDQLISRVDTLTKGSNDSTAALLGQTEISTQALTARLEQILESIRDRSTDFDRASGSLREAQAFISDLLQKNGDALKKLTAAGAEVRGYTSDLKAQSVSLAAIVVGQGNVAGKLATAAGSIEDALNHQDQRLQRYESTVQQFESVMGEVDKRIAAVLQEFGKGFSDYQEGVRKNFDSIVKIANELLPSAALGLEAKYEEFADQMTNFTDTMIEQIEKVKGASNGRPR